MKDDLALTTLRTMLSRLTNLQGIMAKAETHSAEQGTDLSDYVDARLAPDMLAMPHQIVFACLQPSQLVAWLRGEAMPPSVPDPMLGSWDGLKAYLSSCIADIEAALADELRTPAGDKRIELGPINMHMLLPPRRFVDDWLLPNFYFHITTAYALLRMNGVPLGKADFNAHMLPDLRPND